MVNIDKICDITSQVKDELRKLRLRKMNSHSVLILKIDIEEQIVCVDVIFVDIPIVDLIEELPGLQPRYIIYTHKMIHEDQRISYPMCFIHLTPPDSEMELQIMYNVAGTKRALQIEADLTRVYELRDVDELTEEWLKEKLH